MKTDLDLGMCDKLLTTTRSIRKRLDLARPVPPELIEECLEVALQSPSATNTQKWRFVVIRDADKRAGIAKLYKHAFESYWEQADEATYGTTGPASTEAQRMIDSAAYLVNHLHEVPVQVLFCIEDRPRRAAFRSGHSLWLNSAGGLVVYAGRPRAGSWLLLDHSSSQTCRRSSQAAQYSR